MAMLMPDATVMIAGAGPTGMTLAIELARAGVSVRLIDKSDHMARYSQALVVQARTLEQFARYGIADEAVARGRKVHEAKIWSEGKLLAEFALTQIPGPFPFLLMLPQNDTEDLLNRHLESLGVTVERKTELVALADEAGSVRCELRKADGGLERAQFRWVVGCDGAHSTVRSLRQIAFSGESVDLSFLLGDLELEGPDVPGGELSLHLHRGDVVFMARLKGETIRVIVAQHGGNRERSVTLPEFQQALDAAGVRVRIVGSTWMTPFHVNDRQAEDYRSGSVFLAGDASHIHSPVGGQGMNTGIQDAANLAWKLAAVARGADDSLLDSYYAERGAVGKALLRRTGFGLRVASSANPVFEGLRDLALPVLAASETATRLAAGFVSETAIAYRDSPVVVDHGGDGSLRAGDRWPDFSGAGERQPSGAIVVRAPLAGFDELLGSEPKLLVIRLGWVCGVSRSRFQAQRNGWSVWAMR